MCAERVLGEEVKTKGRASDGRKNYPSSVVERKVREGRSTHVDRRRSGSADIDRVGRLCLHIVHLNSEIVELAALLLAQRRRRNSSSTAKRSLFQL